MGERVEASSPNPRGQVTNVARAIDGRVLEAVDAVGKNLLLRFEGDVTVRSHRPLLELRQAELGNAGGTIGVADLARRR